MKKRIKIPKVIKAIILVANFLANPLAINAQANGQAQEVSTIQTGSVIEITRDGHFFEIKLLVNTNGTRSRITLEFQGVYGGGGIPGFVMNYVYQGMDIAFDASKIRIRDGIGYIHLDAILAFDGENILTLTSSFYRPEQTFTSAAAQYLR